MEDRGFEGGIALDTEGVNDAVRALDDPVQSTDEFTAVPQLASSCNGEWAREGRDEKVPHCVKLAVVGKSFDLVNGWTPLFDEALSVLEVLLVLGLLVGELVFQRAI